MQRWSFLVIPLLCWGVTSRAAPAENAIPFAQAREIILLNNNGLKAIATDAEAAKAGVDQAGVRPNPGVEVLLDNFGANEIEASVQQTFELGGKRYLRKQAAQKDHESVQNTRLLTQIELEAEMVRRFIPVPITISKLCVLDSIIATAEITKEQIKKRVDAGATKKTDLIRAEIELEQHALLRSELVRELEQARKKFAVLGGDKRRAVENVTGSLNESLVPALDDLTKALDSSPQMKALTIEKEQLMVQQRQLKAEATPDLDILAGILCNNADRVYSPLLGMSMNIPLFNTNAAAQKQAALKQQVVDEHKSSQFSLLSSDVQDLHSRILEIDKKINTLRNGTIPKAEQVYSILQEYYAAGSIGFLDLTATQTEMLNLQMDLLDIVAERAQVLADLMQLTSLQLQIVK